MTRAGSIRRRRWLAGGLVGAWAAALTGVALWSVGNQPATVPEQRDIGQALPRLQAAAGEVVAAVDGPGRAVVLGELSLSRDCQVTPVRAGVEAVRDVVVHVRAGEARATVDALADRLPDGYAAEVAAGRAGTRFSLHADAGDFIGVDAEATAAARAVTVRLSTDCRPWDGGERGRGDPWDGGERGRGDPWDGGERGRGDPRDGGGQGRDDPRSGGAPGGTDSPGGSDPTNGDDPGRYEPPAGPAPALLGDIVAALGGAAAQASGAGAAEVRAVPCPGGEVAATWVVDIPRLPVDVDARVRTVAGTAVVVQGDRDIRVYRVGDNSVVVERDGDEGRVSVGAGCG